MKLHFSALLASIAAASSVSAERNLQEILSNTDGDAVSTLLDTQDDAASQLYARWYQDVPTIAFDAATNVFTLQFLSSSSLNTANNMDAIFYDENCRWDGEDGVEADVEHAVTPPKIHAVGSDKNAHALATMVSNTPELKFVLDPALLAKDDKVYTSAGVTAVTASMKFCVRTSLGYGTNEDPTVDQISKSAIGKWIRQADLKLDNTFVGGYQEVNFIESIITVIYDLTAGFTVDAFAVEPKIRVETTAIKENVYTLRAYLCQLLNGDILKEEVANEYEGTLMPIDQSASFVADQDGAFGNNVGGKGDGSTTGGVTEGTKAFNQGSLITVCVLPDPVAYAEGIRMNGLTDFNWERTTPQNNQEAIVASAASANQLTSYLHDGCTGEKDFCFFSSVLFADFYRSKGTAEGSGNALLAFKTTRRLGEKEARKLQEDEAASEFGIEVELDITDEGPGALKTAGGASFGFTVLASVIALASAALLA